jgi:hypothetical protein
MDIDRFLASHGAGWDRLARLTRRAGAGAGRLSAGELDELVQLYQRTSADLSYAQTNFADAGLTARLLIWSPGPAPSSTGAAQKRCGRSGGSSPRPSPPPSGIWAERSP